MTSNQATKVKILASAINYNSNNDTLKIIGDLINIEKSCDWLTFDILIIDNNEKNQKKIEFFNEIQTKFCAVKLQSELKVESKVSYIDNENMGFGQAHNLALNIMDTDSQFDALWILNTDVRLTVDVLKESRELLSDGSVSIIGNAIREIVNSKPRLIYGTSRMKSFRGYGTVEIRDEKKKKVDGVVGASMIVKRKVAEAKVRFDPKYFMYVEESDFCLTAARMGFDSYVATNSIVDHVGGKTFGNFQATRWYYKVRNLLYFKKKNFRANNWILIVYLLASTIRQFGFSYEYLRSFLRGVFDYKNNVMGKMPNV